MKEFIKVSVICVTYNQEKYIEQALSGFASQKTNFEIEVIVADDCSTDSTPEIIARFAKDYPNLFRQILRKKNLGVIGNNIDSLRQAKGQYIALCEGDDYWTDPLKLQKQVDLLDKHQDMALCFHPVEVLFESQEEKNHIYPDPKASLSFTVEQLLKGNFIQTNSVMYRRQNYDEMPLDIMPLDWYLHLYHAQFGKIGFIDEVMSVYRRHPGGVWWSQSTQPEQIWEKYGYNFLRLLHEIMLMYGDSPENRKIINNHIAGSYEAIAAIKPQEVADNVALRVVDGAPAETWEYIKDLTRQLSKGAKREFHMQELLDAKARDNELLLNELRDIKSSRLWKALLLTRFSIHTIRHPVWGIRRVTNHLSIKSKRD